MRIKTTEEIFTFGGRNDIIKNEYLLNESDNRVRNGGSGMKKWTLVGKGPKEKEVFPVVSGSFGMNTGAAICLRRC